MHYTDDLSTLSAHQLTGGFFVGWPDPPSPDKHLEILKSSYKVWLAMDGDQVCGFINAISDGLYSAFIPMLEVLSGYQQQGVGSNLTRRMLESLSDLYSIDLCCDENVIPFYIRLGFTQTTCMSIRHYNRQNGL